MLAYDHILGVNPNRPGGWNRPLHLSRIISGTVCLVQFMAAVTTTLQFATGILILPQRETALVAKQAATLDADLQRPFSSGIGTGWNEIEYTAQNQDFHTRGRRQEEQVDVLRRLWTDELVTYHGRWHTIPDAGLNPLPAQRPIPVWFGGHADAVLERVARMGDGWLPGFRTAPAATDHLARLDVYLAQNGRTRADIGIEARLHWSDGSPDQLVDTLNDWQAVGATHISLNTMGAGFHTPAEHMEAIKQFTDKALT
ncbi:MAG: TIGR03619 family F420-dependent LLM class oxidoreductase [Chloroflexota bacterium]